jgi:hypothetical protein
LGESYHLKDDLGKHRTVKKIFNILAVFIFPAVLNSIAEACLVCRIQVNSGIFNQDFAANLFAVLLPVLALSAILLGIFFFDEVRSLFGRKQKNDRF